jgi:putative aldouronate transport system permease protein
MTILASYPISLGNNKFRARSFYTWFFLIAVLFSGGLIPTYLVVLEIGLVNTIWSLILPGAVPLFNVILMQNFMKGLPEEIKESAAIDGAGQFRILAQIVLPIMIVYPFAQKHFVKGIVLGSVKG